MKNKFKLGKRAQIKVAGISHDKPKPAEAGKMRVSPPQRERVTLRCAAGESIRKIARQEKRNRETVTKVVRSREMDEFAQKLSLLQAAHHGFSFK